MYSWTVEKKYRKLTNSVLIRFEQPIANIPDRCSRWSSQSQTASNASHGRAFSWKLQELFQVFFSSCAPSNGRNSFYISLELIERDMKTHIGSSNYLPHWAIYLITLFGWSFRISLMWCLPFSRISRRVPCRMVRSRSRTESKAAEKISLHLWENEEIKSNFLFTNIEQQLGIKSTSVGLISNLHISGVCRNLLRKSN